MKHLLFLTLLLTMAHPIAAGEAPPIPEKFSAYIGGFFGPSYWVELEQGTLHYKVREKGQQKEKTTTITPTPEQWAAFRQALDEIDAWKWKKEYNSGTPDGTQWSLAIAYDHKKLASGGNNQYPGREAKNTDYTKDFERYLAAVKALLGGKEFR